MRLAMHQDSSQLRACLDPVRGIRDLQLRCTPTPRAGLPGPGWQQEAPHCLCSPAHQHLSALLYPHNPPPAPRPHSPETLQRGEADRRCSHLRQGLTPVDHAQANATAIRRQSAANRGRKAAEAAAGAAPCARSAPVGVRSSGYASPAYSPGRVPCYGNIQSVIFPPVPAPLVLWAQPTFPTAAAGECGPVPHQATCVILCSSRYEILAVCLVGEPGGHVVHGCAMRAAQCSLQEWVMQ